MIQITYDLSIEDNEIREEFVRASGPGGQNVNKVASAVHLRFHVLKNQSLPEEVRKQLVNLSGKSITKDGELIISSKRFRTQERNRKDGMDRFMELIRQAAIKPKVRQKTTPLRLQRSVGLKTKSLPEKENS